MQTQSLQSLTDRVRQMAASDAASVADSTSPEERMHRSFIISDVPNSPRTGTPVCSSCADLLPNLERGRVSGNASGDECITCALGAGKPEAYTEPFCSFLTNNPTVYHAVDYFAGKLAAAGFTELPARDQWIDKIVPGGKYWMTRNGTALIAFTVGAAYVPGSGVAMIAGHIDALTAKLKPVSKKPNKAGYVELGVAPYAGALNETWWDRDLSIGGRVILRDPSTSKTSIKLVKLDWPIARVPTLAPHFGVGMLGHNNKETEAVPIIGLESPLPPLGPPGSFISQQPPRLVQLIGKQLGLTPESYANIQNWDLELFDTQPAQTGGMDHEFIFGCRIDDKLCSWSALIALLSTESRPQDSTIKLVALFDNEEIGSLTRQGARANLLPQVIERTVEALCLPARHPFGPGILAQTYARSFLVSADVTHAGHPNFLANYLDEHIPKLNTGVAICADPNGHMTTDAISTSILTRIADLCGAKTQIFQIRNDSRSGGTVGPALSSAMGVRSADAGLPQLSMHSVRATTGALDPGLGVKFFKGFLDYWEQVYEEWH